MKRILIIEDEESIAELEKDYLELSGFEVEIENDGAEGLKKALGEEFDLFILDLMLPEVDGFDICRQVREEKNTPIIMVSAKKDDIDKIRGLGLGADDYIPKPFRPRELVSRIKNILRLTGSIGAVIQLGDVTVDTIKGTALRNGKDLYLSALEYRLLLTFINNRGAVLSRNQLLESIWDVAGEFVNDNTLTVYIKRLRDKIEKDPQNPSIIKTVRGIGYRVDT